MGGRLKMNLVGFCLAGILAAGHAHAAIIYFDDFSGSSETSLNGTVPDTRPGTETWISSVNWKADGTKAASTSANAYLPFTPDAGKTYTLSADVNTTNTNGPDDWLAIGFSNSTATDATFHASTNASPWMLLRSRRGGSDGIQTFLGPGAGGGVNSPAAVGIVNLKIVLDTTTPLWSAQWYRNDDLLRTTSFTTNPAINYVTFGGFSNATGTVDNFSLSVVPEPGAAGLLAGAGLLALRRRRQRDEDKFPDE